MDSAYKLMLFVHGLSGLVALITFWVAALAKKGSPLHVRIGKTYMIAMLGIIVTALPMRSSSACAEVPAWRPFSRIWW